MKRVFLVHGWTGSPEKGWFPWLKKELEKRGFFVVAELMPSPAAPRMEEWVECLKKLVGTSDEETFFVGHSLGCITILRYFESLPENEKAGGAILVAGFTDDIAFRELSSFFLTPIDWKKINSRCKKFVALNSDNDKEVSLKHGYTFKDKIGAKLIVEHKKHMADDILELQSLLDSVLEISS
jgi:predicted alpha/beta hydrolase family esterase